jgi:hypothetical protein
MVEKIIGTKCPASFKGIINRNEYDIENTISKA